MKRLCLTLVFTLLCLMFLIGCSNNNDIQQNNFLITNDNYSMTSSTWGMGIKIDSMAEFPEQYVIEWIVSSGTVHSWNESILQPEAIETNQNGNPFTYSNDTNNGAVIWRPDNFENTEDVSVEAYLYENENFSDPIAHSEIIFENDNGTYQLKTDATK